MKILVSIWMSLLVSSCFGVSAATVPTGMVMIPAGVYHPLFGAAPEAKGAAVAAFYLDALPVTVKEYLEFVRANPQWRRSQVKRIFADESYLSTWTGDFAPGTNASLETPVTYISWFAAKAYAQWKGKRLPTTAEWELAASASPTRPDGENDQTFQRQILQWYETPNSTLGSVTTGQANFWGAKDMHGLVWEWVLDFNSVFLGDESRGSFCGASSTGARDLTDYPAFMRTGFRSSLKANYCVHNLGFRCAKDL